MNERQPISKQGKSFVERALGNGIRWFPRLISAGWGAWNLPGENASYDEIAKACELFVLRKNWDFNPAILRVPVERYFEHVGPNVDNWRDAPEVWGEDDPVKMMGENIIMTNEAEHLIRVEIDAAFEQAASDPWTDDLPPLFYGGRTR